MDGHSPDEEGTAPGGTVLLRQEGEQGVTGSSSRFFGQADAAVVSRRALDTVAELNPQISREIVEIGSSKPVVHSVSCFRKNIESNMRNALYKAAVGLDKDAYGRQVLMMFQLKRLGEYELKYLDYLSSLVTDHSNLKKKFAGKR
ncbi:MAG: PhnD/SsuA/transferrin family substrate-binding protein [Desulfobacterales bacterium]|nr:PhnD/SsuA/transferrin family substrate-binding protein [Desulfobacterales bacterium]